MAKTAIEKLQTKKQHKIVDNLPAGMKWAPEGASMLVSTPTEVNEWISNIPKGKVATITELRASLAKKYKTDITCPISTGIFINIAAAAAEEMKAQGVEVITPYWRMLKSDGELNQKYPGYPDQQKLLLEEEGFLIEQKGKKYFVKEFSNKLFNK